MAQKSPIVDRAVLLDAVLYLIYGMGTAMLPSLVIWSIVWFGVGTFNPWLLMTIWTTFATLLLIILPED